MRKLKRGTKKYKGKLPFKCFNCEKLVILLPNVPMQGVQIVMKKKFPRKKTNIKNNPKGWFARNVTTRRPSRLKRARGYEDMMSVILLTALTNSSQHEISLLPFVFKKAYGNPPLGRSHSNETFLFLLAEEI